jgi:hypothetical protein
MLGLSVSRQHWKLRSPQCDTLIVKAVRQPPVRRWRWMVIAVLAVYGIIYVIFGVKFWHPF